MASSATPEDPDAPGVERDVHRDDASEQSILVAAGECGDVTVAVFVPDDAHPETVRQAFQTAREDADYAVGGGR